jgi:hypothetical protein
MLRNDDYPDDDDLQPLLSAADQEGFSLSYRLAVAAAAVDTTTDAIKIEMDTVSAFAEAVVAPVAPKKPFVDQTKLDLESCIQILKKAKRRNNGCRFSPAMLTGLLALLAASATAYAVMQYFAISNAAKPTEPPAPSALPDLMGQYNEFLIPLLNSVCGAIFPLKDVCHFALLGNNQQKFHMYNFAVSCLSYQTQICNNTLPVSEYPSDCSLNFPFPSGGTSHCIVSANLQAMVNDNKELGESEAICQNRSIELCQVYDTYGQQYGTYQTDIMEYKHALKQMHHDKNIWLWAVGIAAAVSSVIAIISLLAVYKPLIRKKTIAKLPEDESVQLFTIAAKNRVEIYASQTLDGALKLFEDKLCEHRVKKVLASAKFDPKSNLFKLFHGYDVTYYSKEQSKEVTVHIKNDGRQMYRQILLWSQLISVPEKKQAVLTKESEFNRVP